MRASLDILCAGSNILRNSLKFCEQKGYAILQRIILGYSVCLREYQRRNEKEKKTSMNPLKMK